jgi:hypothetical protein
MDQAPRIVAGIVAQSGSMARDLDEHARARVGIRINQRRWLERPVGWGETVSARAAVRR